MAQSFTKVVLIYTYLYESHQNQGPRNGFELKGGQLENRGLAFQKGENTGTLHLLPT